MQGLHPHALYIVLIRDIHIDIVDLEPTSVILF